MALKNILLDRDGTLIVEKHYLSDPAQVALVPGAGEALAAVRQAGLKLFVVTNQSGIGRGYYGEEDFQAVQARLGQLLAAYGVALEGVAHCPHDPAEYCSCRKPGPGLWQTLSAVHGLKPEETAMVGDNASDVAFGLTCGLAESILVLTGHGQRFAAELGLPELTSPWLRLDRSAAAQPASLLPTALAKDLPAAVACLLARPDASP